MKNLLVSYFLCGAGLFTPLAGLHRFYLDRPISGICYLLTWGFFGIGTVIDLIRMPSLVGERNLEIFFWQKMGSDGQRGTSTVSSPEHSILRCASGSGGVVTIPQVSLYAGLSMVDAKIELDKLFRDGFCQKDIDEDGQEIYQFRGLKAKRPLM